MYRRCQYTGPTKPGVRIAFGVQGAEMELPFAETQPAAAAIDTNVDVMEHHTATLAPAAAVGPVFDDEADDNAFVSMPDKPSHAPRSCSPSGTGALKRSRTDDSTGSGERAVNVVSLLCV